MATIGCQACGAKGHPLCERCQGERRPPTSGRFGDSRTECSECGGSGLSHVVCNRCGGSGQIIVGGGTTPSNFTKSSSIARK